jgi:hypothetical protein
VRQCNSLGVDVGETAPTSSAIRRQTGDTEPGEENTRPAVALCATPAGRCSRALGDTASCTSHGPIWKTPIEATAETGVLVASACRGSSLLVLLCNHQGSFQCCTALVWPPGQIAGCNTRHWLGLWLPGSSAFRHLTEVARIARWWHSVQLLKILGWYQMREAAKAGHQVVYFRRRGRGTLSVVTAVWCSCALI